MKPGDVVPLCQAMLNLFTWLIVRHVAATIAAWLCGGILDGHAEGLGSIPRSGNSGVHGHMALPSAALVGQGSAQNVKTI